MSSPSKAVLITGCSTGIGRATAQRLAAGDWTVYATARRPESIADLEQAGCRTLALDVTDEASMKAAVDAVEANEGAVGVLINNAGYSQSGAIETVPMESVRRQFETNVFGVVRLTQLVLGNMRAQRWGKIVNVGSMGGRLTFPGGGHYHATKYALEALSDALRFEVKGFGIDVTLLEPGLIVTEFGEAASGAMASIEGDEGPYAAFNAAVGSITKGAYDGPMKLLGAGPEKVARTIERTIGRRRSPARITITPSAKLMIGTRKLLGDRAWDAAMGAQFPKPS
ncbi:MAG TPA: SDR family NAD(P)-dependent oxidoreductase [Solirubrobacteraceae bacterium]|jgi:NAD(P)-dependent dehydrogenase (short-subunit alcohol dehydrogenase family)